MKERPILMSGPMVRAILEGRKTQTRRIVKPQPSVHDAEPLVRSDFHGPARWFDGHRAGSWNGGNPILCPYGEPGDRLWVKETFAYSEGEVMMTSYERRPVGSKLPMIAYRANMPDLREPPCGKHWKPSIFMRRALSRITLEITGVRVERLQDISEDDAVAEGIGRHIKHGTEWFDFYPIDEEFPGSTTVAKDSFQSLWESINGSDSWAENPWVWVIEFKRKVDQESSR
jgi:hypothetical protein